MQSEKRKLELKVDNLEIENQELQKLEAVNDDGEKLGTNQVAHYQTMKKDMKKLIDFKYAKAGVNYIL